MPDTRPTHHAYHPDHKLHVDLVIAPSLVDKLNSDHPGVRSRAQDALAIMFRKSCEAKYGSDMPYIGRDTLRLSEIDDSNEQEPPVRMGPGGVVLDVDEY